MIKTRKNGSWEYMPCRKYSRKFQYGDIRVGDEYLWWFWEAFTVEATELALGME